MKKIYYHKLIRDNIPAKMDRNGAHYSIKKLSSLQFEKELVKKIAEESDGLHSAKSKGEFVDELSDVIAVIEAIKKLKRINDRQMAIAIKANMKLKGGFTKRIYLNWSEDTGYKTNDRKYKNKV